MKEVEQLTWSLLVVIQNGQDAHDSVAHFTARMVVDHHLGITFS
jgi:hypothetical protein